MAAAGAVRRLAAEYAGRADFYAVYVAEAHARDQWPIGKRFRSDDAPRSVAERCALARRFVPLLDPPAATADAASLLDPPTATTDAASTSDSPAGTRDGRITVLVDGMDDEFLTRYAAWPFRYYVVRNGTVLFKARPRADTLLYEIESDLAACLATL